MISFRRVIAIAGLVVNAVACKTQVPWENTSLIGSAGVNPGKPSHKLSMVWLHHSTGDSLLNGGLLEALLADGVSFYDINYREAVVDGYVIGDHTDIPDWPKTFNTPRFFDTVTTWELSGGKHHEVVMFKSCYPNSHIASDAMLAEYKQHYLDLLPTFKSHPEIMFVAMSTPPLVKARTDADAAARARKFADWLTNEYAVGVKNVKVFDLFNALAILPGKPDANTLAPQFASGGKDSHPSREGAQAVTRRFIPWFNRAVREAGFSE